MTASQQGLHHNFNLKALSSSMGACSHITERCKELFTHYLGYEDCDEHIAYTLAAAFALLRVAYQSKIVEHLNPDLLARTIEHLVKNPYFQDSESQSYPRIRTFLRLLADAIRLFKYSGCSLDAKIHVIVQNVIDSLFQRFDHIHKYPVGLNVGDCDVRFLLKHCEYLLLSLDSNESLGQRLARRVIVGLDFTAHESGDQFQSIRSQVLEPTQRQKLRPPWHDEYIHLEDVCYAIFASDLRMDGERGEHLLAVHLEDVPSVAAILGKTMEAYLSPNRPDAGKLQRLVRNTFGRQLADGGQDEGNEDCLSYGVLDLAYELSFRIRHRSRSRYLVELTRIVKISLERSRPSASHLHRKATDTWNRILELTEKDSVLYGNNEDREAVVRWISEHGDNHREGAEYSRT